MRITFVLLMLFAIVFVFTCICLHLHTKLGYAEGRITLLEVKANYCEQSEKTLRESVDLQTKCIRDLNDIVKKSVEIKEPTEPDTKALLGGWIVEDPELSRKQPQPNIVALYPWRQAELNQVLGLYGFREERMNEMRRYILQNGDFKLSY